MPPQEHTIFLNRALPLLQRDARLLGVAAAGSWITQNLDEFSDLDLVVVSEPAAQEHLLNERMRIAAELGPLLTAFTGEHVGEPRLLICLYDEPLLHVDLKFISLDDLGRRIENPAVLWERDGKLTAKIADGSPHFPPPDPQWIEDRFWTWAHYGAQKLGRGELFEVIDFLSFWRERVLGPLSLMKHGQIPRGVRRLETLATADVPAFRQTVAVHERASCARALQAAIALYQRLRNECAPPTLVRRDRAEKAALRYLEDIIARGE